MDGQSINICEPTNQPVIIFEDGADKTVRKAAAELQAYIEKLCGACPDIHEGLDVTQAPDKQMILLGHYQHQLVREWVRPEDDFETRAPDTFALRSGQQQEVNTVCVIGCDSMGVLYGTYELIEQMGVTFTLFEDLIPSQSDFVTIPKLDKLYEPALIKRRGFHIPMLDVNSGIQSFDDYRRLIDQMVKLKLNYINFLVCAAEPWVDYSFRGEKNGIGDINSRESGFLTPKKVVPDPSTENITFGSEHFTNRRFMAPLELQDVQSREDGIAKFQDLMHRVMNYAKASGVNIGLATDLTEVPPNFAKHMHAPRMTNPDTTIFGQKVDPLDPVMREHAEVLLQELFDTYPQIDDFFVFNPEGYHFRPEADELYRQLKPEFQNAKETFEQNWIETCPYARNGKTADEIIEVDIAHFESARKSVETARQLRPDLTIGMAFLFRGYLLQDADKLMDRDVPFMEYQSSGVVAIKNDVNAEYFDNMGERDRYIIARVDDDGSMFGIPFYLRQFERDGLFGPAVKAGVNSMVGQLWRARGTEHHTRFLARGAWNPQLNADSFYQGYAKAVFGDDAAGRMLRAFNTLEDCEELLGWRGMKNFRWADGCRELASLGSALLNQERPFEGPKNAEAMHRTATCITIFEDTRVPRDTVREGKFEIFDQAAMLLCQALEHMQAAESHVNDKGRGLLEYLISKTKAYRVHLEMVALLCRGFARYAEAFMNHKQNDEQLASALEQASELFQQANDKARESARRVAEIVDHPSDLAVLFQVNRFNVEKVAKVTAQVQRVTDYHQGKGWTEIKDKNWAEVDSDEGWNN